jgi:hypothetical protein
MIKRVIVSPNCVRVSLNTSALCRAAGIVANKAASSLYELNLSARLRRRGVETKIVMAGRIDSLATASPNLIRLIGNALKWFEKLRSGEARSIEHLARECTANASDISRYISLAFLAPDIVEAIVNGQQPIELTVTRLKKLCPLPLSWDDQRRVLGFTLGT